MITGSEKIQKGPLHSRLAPLKAGQHLTPKTQKIDNRERKMNPRAKINRSIVGTQPVGNIDHQFSYRMVGIVCCVVDLSDSLRLVGKKIGDAGDIFHMNETNFISATAGNSMELIFEKHLNHF